jgi:hypothetical protein
LLHRFLGIGLLLFAAVAGVMRFLGRLPLVPPDNATAIIGFVFSGVVAAIVIVAIGVLRPRVPARSPGQAVEAFWTTPAVAAKVLPVWFVLEGAAVLGLVGFLVTGVPMVAGFAALAIAVFWWSGPDSFAKP